MTMREALDEMNRWHARAKLMERALERVERDPGNAVPIARKALAAKAVA